MSYRSYSVSNNIIPLSIGFPSRNLALSSRYLVCFDSWMVASLKILELVRNLNIFLSSLETRKLVTFFRIVGL